MDSKEKLMKYELALTNLANILSKYQNIFDVCMVDFVTRNVIDKAIPPNLRESMRQLSENEISLLPSYFFSQQNSNVIKTSPLDEIIQELQQYTLESLNVVDEKENFLIKLNSIGRKESITSLKHFDKFMSDKKMHEVEIMSETIRHLCMKKDVDTLIDLGSGKAYLSQVLAASDENLQILAIDSSSENSEGAKKRSDRLSSKWDALKKRAEYRALGQEPPVRSKHSRSKRKPNNNDASKEVRKIDEKLKYITKFVDINTNLKLLLLESFNDRNTTISEFNNDRLGLIGLHTCGNLAPNSIKLWLSNDSMKFICNVGCCYHHLDEEFYRSPYLKKDQESNITPTFPLSSKLKSLRYKLGRSARMIAAQPMDRLRTNKELPSESLLWRAILQHILLTHNPELNFGDHQVFTLEYHLIGGIQLFLKFNAFSNFLKLFLILHFRWEELHQNVLHLRIMLKRLSKNLIFSSA